MFVDWETPEAVFNILKKCSERQPCDISGIRDYRMIDEHGGIQWPCPSGVDEESIEQERRLFVDKRFYHADGKAKFMFESPRPTPEPATKQFPFILLTGRGTASQWHTQTRTKNSPVLTKLYPDSIYVEINPSDARENNIQPNQWVTVESQRGRVKAKAFVTHSVEPGQVFIPMHYETTNQLTDSVFDPYSKQPSYKACAVRLRKPIE